MPYIGKSPEFGVRERFYFTQTSAGATSISGFDDNGTTLRFTDGNYVDVYLNGVLLVDGVDYGTSTANTISSLSALADEDVIEIVVYDVFNLAKNNAEVTRTRYYKTASGSETTISGNDDSGVAITFPAGAQLDVSLNGVSLVAGTDYNTSTANTISGLSALSAGQVIEIVKYEKFVVSDTVSKAAGGTFVGGITATGGLNVGTIKEATGTNTAMTIDSSGRVAMPNKIAFTAGYNSTTGAYAALVTSLGLANVVPFNFVTQGGTNGTHPNWSNTTHAFTAPIAGAYFISTGGLFESAVTNSVNIAKNQDIVHQARFYTTANRGVGGSVILQLAVNDEIQLHAPAPLYLDYDNVYSFMSIAFLG